MKTAIESRAMRLNWDCGCHLPTSAITSSSARSSTASSCTARQIDLNREPCGQPTFSYTANPDLFPRYNNPPWSFSCADPKQPHIILLFPSLNPNTARLILGVAKTLHHVTSVGGAIRSAKVPRSSHPLLQRHHRRRVLSLPLEISAIASTRLGQLACGRVREYRVPPIPSQWLHDHTHRNHVEGNAKRQECHQGLLISTGEGSQW